MPENFDAQLAELYFRFDEHVKGSERAASFIKMTFNDHVQQTDNYYKDKHNFEDQIKEINGELNELRARLELLRKKIDNA